jgi:hypothetical protein
MLLRSSFDHLSRLARAADREALVSMKASVTLRAVGIRGGRTAALDHGAASFVGACGRAQTVIVELGDALAAHRRAQALVAARLRAEAVVGTADLTLSVSKGTVSSQHAAV